MEKKMKYDIAVIGAGPAGTAAACAARRYGARVLLIERDGVPGGMATSGMINNFCGEADSKFFRRVLERAEPRRKEGRKLFSPEKMKDILISEIVNSGADLLLHSLVVGIDASEGIVKSISVASKMGLIEVSADQFIDATGDGDLAFYAGVPFDVGREGDSLMQPLTLEFLVGGVDTERALFRSAKNDPAIKDAMEKALADGSVPFPIKTVCLLDGDTEGTAFVSMTNSVMKDGTDSFDLTKAELECRSQIPSIISFLRKNVPGYENCYVITTASYAGVRETRRFRGLYTLTEDDILSERVFEDRITNKVAFSFDVHDPSGVNATSSAPRYSGESYTIPYRSIVPTGMKNLLLSGRCISGNHLALSSYRVMPICMAIGEGAGLCASEAVKRGAFACELDAEAIKAVQSAL